MRALIAAAACLLVPTSAWAYGETDDDGSPNHRERLLHVLTNQVRQAPHDFPDWDTSLASAEPRGPLALQPGLLSAARFHANDMAANGCFSHESCDGTATFARIGRYFSGPAGENIYTSIGDASARRAMVGWMNSDGHRRNILRHEWEWLGTGFSGSGRQIYFVQNFGQGGLTSMPNIVGGAYEDRGAEYALLANYYDANGRAPVELVAILDGERLPMTSIAGRSGNETLEAIAPAVDGCVGLSFEATTAGQDRVVFPTTGELLVGNGCTAQFRAAKVETKPVDQVYQDADVEEGGCTCVSPETAAPWALFALLPLFIRRKR